MYLYPGLWALESLDCVAHVIRSTCCCWQLVVQLVLSLYKKAVLGARGRGKLRKLNPSTCLEPVGRFSRMSQYKQQVGGGSAADATQLLVILLTPLRGLNPLNPQSNFKTDLFGQRQMTNGADYGR
jgi:hypothetical protein